MGYVLGQQFVDPYKHRFWSLLYRTFYDTASFNAETKHHFMYDYFTIHFKIIFYPSHSFTMFYYWCLCYSVYLHPATLCWSPRLLSDLCHCTYRHNWRGSCRLNHIWISRFEICWFSKAAKKTHFHAHWKRSLKNLLTFQGTKQTNNWKPVLANIIEHQEIREINNACLSLTLSESYIQPAEATSNKRVGLVWLGHVSLIRSQFFLIHLLTSSPLSSPVLSSTEAEITPQRQSMFDT